MSALRAAFRVAARRVQPRALSQVLRSGSVTTKFQSIGVSAPVKSWQMGSTWSRALHTSRGAAGIVPFNLADIGEGIAEVEITKWHVAEGDTVQEFDVICDVQSDKANVDITSRYAGKIAKLYYAEGDMAKVGSPLCDFDVEGMSSEETAAPAETPAETPAATPAAPKPSGGAGEASAPAASGKVLSTPAVRHIAKQNNIDLSQVVATGKGGRILKEDVLAFMNGTAAARSSVSGPVSPVSSALPPKRPPPAARPPPVSLAEDTVVPIKGLQRAMVKSMTEAAYVPHFGYADEFSVNALTDVRKSVQDYAISQNNKLSYMPFIIKAASLALAEHPKINAWVDSECTAVTLKASHNIGVAVDSPQGLIVPNIKNVQDLSIMDIQAELHRLIHLASDGKLGGEDLADGTFTISNVGSIGGTYTSPVIPPGTVAICALGSFKRVPVFDANDNVVADTIMNVSFAADHRVLDGATVANFSNRWKELLSTPGHMMLNMR